MRDLLIFKSNWKSKIYAHFSTIACNSSFDPFRVDRRLTESQILIDKRDQQIQEC